MGTDLTTRFIYTCGACKGRLPKPEVYRATGNDGEHAHLCEQHARELDPNFLGRFYVRVHFEPQKKDG